MTQSDIKKIVENLIQTFLDAGKISIDLRKKGLTKEIKSDNTPVSNGDLEVNKILSKKILSLTPNIPIVSEETSENKSKNNLENFWLIDPIDGTYDYINDLDEFTINAALIVNKLPTIGLIYAPAKNRMFYSYGDNFSFELINGVPINDSDIISFTKTYRDFFEKHSITFFEATTAMAFDYFRKNKIDIAIVETGLGGRLDSTNVLSPIHTIITEIDFDHTHLLGETVEEITAEKCGIIKNSIPNTTINTKSNIAEVIDKFSTEQNTNTNYINKDLINIAEHKTNKLHLNYYDSSYILPQAGSFQAENAVLAIETIKNEFKNITNNQIQDGLDQWFWPGRMQQMGENIFYDVAHNSSGVNTLTSDLFDIYNQKPIGLVVMKNDKIRPEIISLFENAFKELIISTIPSKDILSKNDIKSIKSLNNYQFIENLNDALGLLKNKQFDGPKVIFGSHYIAKYVYKFFDFSFDKGNI